MTFRLVAVAAIVSLASAAPVSGEDPARRPLPPIDVPHDGPPGAYMAPPPGAWRPDCRIGEPPRERRSRLPRCVDGPPMPPPMMPGAPYGMVTPGYVVPPVMWVKVPIVRERQDCCEEVIEERTIVEPAPREAARRHAPAGKAQRLKR